MDAYTVKKLMPRIVIAIILANLSFAICTLVIDVTNTIGGAIPQIFDSFSSNAGIGGALGGEKAGAVVAIAATVAGAALFAGGIFVIVPMLLSIAMAIGVALATIIIRRVLIVLMVVIAPIAIALWVIPGGEALAKRWWKLFLQLLIIYPAIMALVYSGKLVASIIAGNAVTPSSTSPTGYVLTSSGAQNISTFDAVAIVGALVVPFFLLPTVFKLASSTLGNITGRINDRSKGLIDRSKKMRGQKIAQNLQKIQSGSRFKNAKSPTSFKGRLNTGLQAASIVATGKAGLRPTPNRLRTELAASRTSANFNAAKEMIEKDPEMQLIKNDDDKLHALVHGKDEASVRNILKASASGRFDKPHQQGALDQAVAEIMRVRKNNGVQAARVAGVMQQAGTGTAYNTVGEMMNDINFASGGDRTTAGLMLAQMRGAAMQSGRVDLGGAGFADMLIGMDDLRRSAAGTGGYIHGTNRADVAAATQATTDKILGKVWNSQGGATLVHSSMKDTAVEQLGNVMVDSVGGALNTQNDRAAVQQLASLSNVYDGMKGASPAKARIMADKVLSHQINVSQLSPDMQRRLDSAITSYSWEEKQVLDQNTGDYVTQRTPTKTGSKATITYAEAIEALRSDSEWQQMSREYQRATDAAQAQGPPAGPGGLPPAPGVGPQQQGP